MEAAVDSMRNLGLLFLSMRSGLLEGGPLTIKLAL